MDQNQKMVVAQMREAVQKQGCSAEGYGDITLMRFLIARSLDKEKAAKMFVQWQKWRASFVPLNYIPDSQVADELNAKKAFLQGLSTKAHPVFIVKVNKHFPSKDHTQFKKYVIHLLDKIIASGCRGKEVGNEKLITVLDMQHISYKNVDVRAMITGFQFLQAYYPERLAKCYILHMPAFFVRVWKLVVRFLDKATIQKIVIVTTEEERRELVGEVGEDVLPEELGGRAKLTLVQDVHLKPMEDSLTLSES